MVKSGIVLRDNDTPAALALNRLEGSLGIVCVLMDGPKSLQDLQEATGATKRKLRFVLDCMMDDGLIRRTSSGTYQLTDDGQALKSILRELGKWWDIWGSRR